MAKPKDGTHRNADFVAAATDLPTRPTPLPECWRIFHQVLEHAGRILLYGPPGTGKTRQALSAGVRPGERASHLIMTQDTPAAELRGMWVPVPGGFDWLDGPAIAAWRSGSRLVLDEIDHASGDVMNLLMSIVDAPGSAYLTLPTRETVEPAPGFSVIATMNGDPDQLPPALRDRFPVAIEIDAVHPAAFAGLPEDILRAASATALLPAERRLSVRAWIQFAHLRERVGASNAAKAVFGPQRAKDVEAAVLLAQN